MVGGRSNNAHDQDDLCPCQIGADCIATAAKHEQADEICRGQRDLRTPGRRGDDADRQNDRPGKHPEQKQEPDRKDLQFRRRGAVRPPSPARRRIPQWYTRALRDEGATSTRQQSLGLGTDRGRRKVVQRGANAAAAGSGRPTVSTTAPRHRRNRVGVWLRIDRRTARV